mmetsp:Transcript_12112/g.29216  ORF Transcript_12112/g.29216 Transcript_12112/m.29216 type:complete len:580 (+) Transcript_12112:274-2013(+)
MVQQPHYNRQTLSLLSKSYQRRHDRYGCRRRCTFWMIGLLLAIAVSISIFTYNFHYQYYHYTDPSMGNNNNDRSFVVNTLSSSLRRSVDSRKNSSASIRVTGTSQQRRTPTREGVEDGTGGQPQRVRLVHVISPFVEGCIDAAIDNTKDDSPGGKLLYPLGLNQWTTMQSIKRALQQINDQTFTTGITDNNNNNNNIDGNGVKVNNIDVTVLCTVFETDFEILSSPDAGLPCHKFVTLKRSTRTQYPPNTTNSNLELPFISDMIDAAMSLFDGDEDDETSSYHVMLTNSDIGLTPMFYTRVYEILQIWDSFSMNRMTIPLDGYDRLVRQVAPLTSLQTTSEAESFYESLKEYIEQSMMIYDKNGNDPSSSSVLSKAIPHPGYDLFCMSSTVLKRVTFGDMFLGRSPWGMNVHLLLQIMADSYVNIKSNSNGTFHLGDEKRWMEPDANIKNDKGDGTSDSTSSHDNVDAAVRESFALFGFCPCNDDPATMRNILAVQNNINCVHWFLGQRALANKSSNSSSPAFSSPAFVPGFVRHGWEEWYLHRTMPEQNDSSDSQGEHVGLIRDGIGRPTCRVEKLQQ